MNRDALTLKAKKFLAIQSLFYTLANSIEALVPFLLAPLLTRMLDPTAYGVWVLFVRQQTDGGQRRGRGIETRIDRKA